MAFFRNIWLGYKSYYKALKLIWEQRLYWYIVIPALLMLGIYKIGYSIHLHAPTTEAKTINGIIWYLLQLMIEILIATTLMRFAKYIVVILLAPLFSKLSEKVDFLLSGKEYRADFKQIVSDIKRSVRLGIRNMMWEVFFFTLIFLISLIGWQNFNDSPIRHLLIFVSFYYYGFAFMDYTHERLKMNFHASVQHVRSNRGLALALGSIYSILIWNFVDISTLFDWTNFSDEPWKFLGIFSMNVGLWLCASFAPIWAIVAATIAMNDLLAKQKKPV
jgi:CysZ protein